jgi:hypothetical protein
VLDEEAGVLDDEEAGGVCLGGSFGVRNSQLEPKRFGMDGDGGIGDGGDVFRAAEDVDNVDWKWDVFEAGVGVFAQDFGLVGIDWDDFVADPLEVGGDFVGGPARVGGKADDGDGFGGAEEIDDVVGRWRGIIANLNEHVDWMSLDGERVNEKVTSGEWQAEKRNSKLLGVSRIEREDSAFVARYHDRITAQKQIHAKMPIAVTNQFLTAASKPKNAIIPPAHRRP